MTSSTPSESVGLDGGQAAQPDRLIVGKIIRPHGIRGEVLVDMRTDSPAERFVAGSVYFTGSVTSRTVTLESGRWHQGRLIAIFEEIPDRDQAEAARGLLLWVDRATITEPEDPDEFNDHQLVGLTVVTVEGEEVGSVARIDHAPAADLLVVRRPDATFALVPFVRQIVPTVDVPGGRVIIDPPSGLLDL